MRRCRRSLRRRQSTVTLGMLGCAWQVVPHVVVDASTHLGRLGDRVSRVRQRTPHLSEPVGSLGLTTRCGPFGIVFHWLFVPSSRPPYSIRIPAGSQKLVELPGQKGATIDAAAGPGVEGDPCIALLRRRLLDQPTVWSW